MKRLDKMECDGKIIMIIAICFLLFFVALLIVKVHFNYIRSQVKIISEDDYFPMKPTIGRIYIFKKDMATVWYNASKIKHEANQITVESTDLVDVKYLGFEEIEEGTKLYFINGMSETDFYITDKWRYISLISEKGALTQLRVLEYDNDSIKVELTWLGKDHHEALRDLAYKAWKDKI